MERKTIFLDFDGVLFDTVLESYLLSRYAFSEISPFEQVDENEYKLFYSARYMITTSWHYYYIMRIIKEDKINELVDFEKRYQYYMKNRDIEKDGDFDKTFQAKRKDLMENHYDFWNSLDKPYPFLKEIIKLRQEFDIKILSTKNEEAILKKLKEFDWIIDSQNVIGKSKLKDFKCSKKEFLKQYIETNNLKEAIFIDDCEDTINKCSDLINLTSLNANWGYVANKKNGFSENEILKIIKENKNG